MSTNVIPYEGWSLIGEKGVGQNLSIDLSKYTELFLLVSPFGSSRIYLMPAHVLVASLTTDDNFAFGFGGTLNSATPYGCRANVAISKRLNTITLSQVQYDSANQTGATMTVYAR